MSTMADGPSGDGESRRSTWRAIKRWFDRVDGVEQSLRAQLEEAIDDHEGDRGAASNGDLSALERDMLRNLLHFSEHDADDVAIPRGEIVAVPETATWEEVVSAFAEHGHSRMPVYRDSLDEPLGFIHIKDLVAEGVETPEQYHFLRTHRANVIQGYLFSKPRPAAEVRAWLPRIAEEPTVHADSEGEPARA